MSSRHKKNNGAGQEHVESLGHYMTTTTFTLRKIWSHWKILSTKRAWSNLHFNESWWLLYWEWYGPLALGWTWANELGYGNNLGGRMAWTRWWQWEMVRFWIYFETRVDQIYWWVECDIRERDREATRKPQEFWLWQLVECTEVENCQGNNERVSSGVKFQNVGLEYHVEMHLYSNFPAEQPQVPYILFHLFLLHFRWEKKFEDPIVNILTCNNVNIDT